METLVDIDTSAYRLRLDVRADLTPELRAKAVRAGARYLTELQEDMTPPPGLSLRFIKSYDVAKDLHPRTLDVYGVHQPSYLDLTRHCERLGIPQSVLDAALWALQTIRCCDQLEAVERFEHGLRQVEERDTQKVWW